MISCIHCGTTPILTSGAQVYPHRPELAEKPIWRCPVCPASWVGCHPGGETPLGNPADQPTRGARIKLHHMILDPLWQRYSKKFGHLSKRLRKNARRRTYRFLAAHMGLAPDRVHTAMFDLDQCRQAWRVLKDQTPETIYAWNEATRSDGRGSESLGDPNVSACNQGVSA